MLLKQSTARSLVVFMTDSTDHITGKTGLTLTITASKDGAAFGSISPSVTELSNGWYKLALTTSHTDTLGDLALHITATGADPSDLVRQVVLDLPGASVSSVTGAVGSVTGAVGSVTGNVGGNVVGSVASVTGAVGSVTGNVGGNVVGSVASVTGAVGSVTGAVGSVTGNVGGNVVGSVASVTARVTANTDQLAGQTVTAGAGVTFPSSVASPTNITAGTITTATNLTNAPTAGDFTAAMKTSLNAATPASVTGAVGSVTGNVGGNVVGSVGSVVARVTANTDELAGQTVTAAAGVTFPSSVASPTNITTVGAVSGAVGSVTGNVGGNVVGSVASVVGDVGGNVVGSVASVTARVTANTDQLAGQTVTAAAGVTFPTSVASPTNITAGTITTATNLTNAPTSGDFTAAMKTSLNAATPASVTGAVGSVTGAVGSVTGNVGGNVTGSVGSVASGGITSGSFATDAIDANALAANAVAEIQSGLSTLTAAGVRSAVGLASASLDTQLGLIAGYIDTEVGTIKGVTDKLDTALELDGSVYRFTTNALEQAPTGGTAPTVVQIADEVQTRTIAAVSVVNGLAANTVNASALATSAVDEIRDGIWAKVVDGTFTARDLLYWIASVQVGKDTIVSTGPGTATVTFRNPSDTVDAVVADMTNRLRTAMTLTP
jgi:hypothetical protein